MRARAPRPSARSGGTRSSNPGPGPQSVKPVGGAEAAGFDDGNVEAKKKKKLGKLSKKRKAEGASNDDADDATAAAAEKKSKKSAVDATHKAVSKRHDSKPAWTNQTRREQKDWANEQKALQAQLHPHSGDHRSGRGSG